ncbi:la-related protein 1C-like [Cucurbita pepo subsp. pepo]|uniref:la-related protein 1C-like n=1 Tax=Cucurbita pepo subsp. pepo TaxID=3664 RepID=UPI000C9D5B31|nr:la-related protein 1C-like [Cucurbita pepo subsp. pepo]
MATVNHRSPSPTSFKGDNTYEFPPKNHLCAWAAVVRGEPELISQSPLSSSSSFSTVSAPETPETPAPAPTSDFFASSEEGAPVMGADSWPDLAESAKASPKLAGPTIVPPQRQATNNAKSDPSLKHPVVARQRSSRRSGGGGSSMGGPARGFYRPPPPPPPPPPFPVFQIPCSMMPAIPDPSHGEPLFRSNNRHPRAIAGFVPQTNFVSDYPNFFPRGNFALHPRGNGHYQNNRGGKQRDQDRGVYSNARDAHFRQHRPSTRGFMRPTPPYTAQFPQPVIPYGNPMPPPEFVYVPTWPLETYRGTPFMPPPSVYYSAVDPTLSASLVNQIEYYFSDTNLITDGYLRCRMDDQGWVPISLIASFSMVKNLTTNIQWIIESLRTSTVLEVQDNRIRKRNEWKKWIINSNQLRTDLTSSTPSGSDHDSLATSFQGVRVDEGINQSTPSDTDPRNTESTTKIQSSESAGSSQLTNGEVNQDVQTDI